MNNLSVQDIGPVTRPDNFSFVFKLLGFMPYITIAVLIVAVVIWVVFGVKKLRWAKMLAIALTVITVIAAISSLGGIFIAGNRGKDTRDMERFENFKYERNSEF